MCVYLPVAQPLSKLVMPQIHIPSPRPSVLMMGTTQILPEIQNPCYLHALVYIYIAIRTKPRVKCQSLKYF